MIMRFLKLAVATSILLPSGSLALAAEVKATAPAPVTAAPAPASKGTPAPAKKAKSLKPPRVRKHLPKPDPAKQVEINHATKAQLMTLPGVTDAVADAIIKGRPYMSKYNLETQHILPAGHFPGLKTLVRCDPDPGLVAKAKK